MDIGIFVTIVCHYQRSRLILYLSGYRHFWFSVFEVCWVSLLGALGAVYLERMLYCKVAPMVVWYCKVTAMMVGYCKEAPMVVGYCKSRPWW